MIVNIGEITSALSKIKEITNGDKNIPGVMLEVDNDVLNVCYSDGRKSLISKIDVTPEESDPDCQIVLDFNRFDNSISNCQPSGRIVVDDIRFSFEDGSKIMKITAEQKYITESEDGTEVERVMSEKEMKVAWVEAGSSLKSSLLARMKYDNIFECDSTDKWTAGELADILSKVSVEKAKVVYMSPRIQKVFVSNKTHTTSVPVEPLEVTELDMLELKNEVGDDEEKLAVGIAELKKKMKHSAVMSTATAKQLCSILNKMDREEEVYTYVEESFFGLFNAEETVGAFVEMVQGNKTHVDTFSTYDNMLFGTYQLTFAREFLADSIKTAVSTTNSEKLGISFEQGEDGVDIVIDALNVNASVEDKYRVCSDECIDLQGSIESEKMQVSLKVIYEMLAQLKTDLVAFDIEVKPDKTKVLRLADIDMNKLEHEYYRARRELGLTDIDPTPVEEKIKYRKNTLGTTQYTMLG